MIDLIFITTRIKLDATLEVFRQTENTESKQWIKIVKQQIVLCFLCVFCVSVFKKSLLYVFNTKTVHLVIVAQLLQEP